MVFVGVEGWNCLSSSRWRLLPSSLHRRRKPKLCSLSKRMLNSSFNSPLFLLSLFLSPTLCLEIGAIWLAGPSRNKRCEAGLGEGVAVFYEPLKFYSSLHRGSLRPRGHHALNKLPSFLHPHLPNICLPTLPSPPHPQTLPPTDLMDCLLFDVQVRLHHFFPLSRSLCFALHLCSVVWRFDWCGSSACLYYVWIRLAWVCESVPVRALHTCSMSINSFGVSYSSLCFSVSWVHTKLFKGWGRLCPSAFCFKQL